MKFVLKANVHQNGAGSLIVGIVHAGAQAESKPLIQKRAHVVRVWSVQIDNGSHFNKDDRENDRLNLMEVDMPKDKYQRLSEGHNAGAAVHS